MGILDKPKQKLEQVGDKAKDLGETVKGKAKDVILKSIEAVPAEHVADLIMAAAQKKATINALLQDRSADVRVGGIVVRLGPPPRWL